MKLWPHLRLKPRPEEEWRASKYAMMTSQQAAHLLGVTEGTMRGWRIKQKSGEVIFDAFPPFEESSNGRITYRRDVLKDWLMLTMRSSCVRPKPTEEWPQHDDDALTPERAARLLGVTKDTLSQWREAQKPAASALFHSYPPWEAEGGRVLYICGKLKEWVATDCRREPVAWWEVFE